MNNCIINPIICFTYLIKLTYLYDLNIFELLSEITVLYRYYSTVEKEKSVGIDKY